MAHTINNLCKKKIRVRFSVVFETEVEIEAGQTKVSDILEAIHIPENETVKYVSGTMELDSLRPVQPSK